MPGGQAGAGGGVRRSPGWRSPGRRPSCDVSVPTTRYSRRLSGGRPGRAPSSSARTGSRWRWSLADRWLQGMTGVQFRAGPMRCTRRPSGGCSSPTAMRPPAPAGLQAMALGQIDLYLIALGAARAAAVPGSHRSAQQLGRAIGPPAAPELVRIVGPQWSPRCHELRDLFARNHLRSASTPPTPRRAAAARRTPGWTGRPSAGGAAVGRAGPGRPVQRPARPSAGRAGPSPTPGATTSPIVGAGPAGLAAAVYGASEGLRTLLIEREARRRAGRHQLPDPQLPRLSRGDQRRGARRRGPAEQAVVVRRRLHLRPSARPGCGAPAPTGC